MQKAKQVVLVVDRGPRGFVYRVDSQLLAFQDLRDALGKKKLPPYPAAPPKVIRLVHPDVTIAMIGNLKGLVTKVGYDLPQVCFDRHKLKAQELRFLPSDIPFSQLADDSSKRTVSRQVKK